MPMDSAAYRALLRPALPRIADFVQQAHATTILDFGPIELPAMDGITMQKALSIPQADRDSCLAVCTFGLSLLPKHDFTHILGTIHAEASHAAFLDFKLAERNLELPACLLLQGLRRIWGTEGRSLLAEGGLEGMLWRKRELFQPVERYTLWGGGLFCVLVKCLHHGTTI